MIQITFDEKDLPHQEVLRATARYFSELAGDPAQTTVTHEQVGDIARIVKVTSFNGCDSAYKHLTVADTGHVNAEELADADMGKDADRPNDAPSTADVPPPPTAPEDVFGQKNVPQPPAVPPVPAENAPTDNVDPTSPAGVDSKGFPWDERIHSSSKAKNADGTWRQRRGVQPLTVSEVEKELKQSENSVPLPPIVSVEESVPGDFFNAASAPAAPPPDVAPTTFPQLVQWVMGHISAKRLTQHEVNEVVKELGLPGVPAVAANPAMIPQVHAKIVELLNMVKE